MIFYDSKTHRVSYFEVSLAGAFLFLVLLFCLSFFSTTETHAAYNDANFASTTLIVGGYSLVITGQVERLVSRTNDFDVVLRPSSTFTVLSTDKKDFSISVSGTPTHTKTCGTSFSTIVFTSPPSVATSTVSINGNCSSASVPAQVSGLGAVASDTKAFLTWSVPSDGGSALTDYLVEYKLIGSSTYTLFSDGVSTTSSTTLTGLSNGSTYDVRVAAVNLIGIGATSTSVNVSPNSSASSTPSAPLSVTAAPLDARATVSFSAPLSNGGATITSYTAVSSPGGITATSTVSPIVVTGLTNAQTYTFIVKATNSVGTGPDSLASNPVVPTAGGSTGGGYPNPPSGGGGGGTVYIPPTGGVVTNPTQPVAVYPPFPTESLGIVLTRPLFYGVTGVEVKTLQKLLVGLSLLTFSPGDIPGRFGLKTQQAVQQLQCLYKIVCSGSPQETQWGIVGPNTRKAINEQAQGASNTLPAGLIIAYSLGSHGEEVRRLQQILVARSLLVPAPDDVLGLYGSKTEKAVQQLQCLYKIVCTGSPTTTGWGAIDQQTLVLLNSF